MITDTIIAAALLANFFTWFFAPFDNVRDYIVTKWVDFTIRYKLYFLTRAAVIITCAKCMAFWGTLIYTQNLIDAILASMLALFIKWMLKYISQND